MIVQGSVNPSSVWIRFTENDIATVRLTRDVTSSQNDQNQTVYSYEEIEIQVPNRTDLETYLTSNADFYWSQALDAARQVQVEYLLQALNSVLLQGFASSADGTARTYGFSDLDQKHWDWIRGMVLAGTCPNPMQVKDINGNRVQMTPTQCSQLCTDAQNFYLTNYQHWDSKEQTAVNAQSISDVQAVIW